MNIHHGYLRDPASRERDTDIHTEERGETSSTLETLQRQEAGRQRFILTSEENGYI
jgi:hypothetical protein